MASDSTKGTQLTLEDDNAPPQGKRVVRNGSPSNDLVLSAYAAAFNSHAETALAIVSAEADIHAQNEDSLTSLHFSDWLGHAETARVLRSESVDSRKNKGVTF